MSSKASYMQPTNPQLPWECLQTGDQRAHSYLEQLAARVVRVCTAVIKAKGSYFEELQIKR